MAHNARRHIAPSKKATNPDRLTVIIPAAGIGKRMKSRGPKGLFVVHNGMSVLELQIRGILQVYPNADIIIVGGFQCEKIRKELWGDFPVRIVYNNDYETTNVMHSIRIGMSAMLVGPVLLMHGDLVFNTHTIAGLVDKKSALLVAGTSQINKTEVGIGHQDGIVTNLSHALACKWGQMAYLCGKELEMFTILAWNSKKSSQLFLYEALNYIIERHGTFLAYQPRGSKIVEIDNYSDLIKARQI